MSRAHHEWRLQHLKNHGRWPSRDDEAEHFFFQRQLEQLAPTTIEQLTTYPLLPMPADDRVDALFHAHRWSYGDTVVRYPKSISYTDGV